LEQEIGARLFDRTNKSVKLTDAGKYFKKEAEQIILNLESATLKTKKIAENVSGEYRIAYISSTFSKNISDLVQFLTGKYPYLNIKLYEVSTTKQISAIELGKIDLGILRAPIVSTKIETRVWFKDYYSLVFNSKKVALKSVNDIQKLKDEVFVFFNKDYAPNFYNSLIEICSKYGFLPNVVHESNNINSIIQLVRNGLGISIVPSSIAKHNNDPELTFLSLKELNYCTEVSLATPFDHNNEITNAAISFLTN